MIVKKIILVCPECEEESIVPFNKIELDWDRVLTLTFQCTKCGAWIENDSVDFEED